MKLASIASLLLASVVIGSSAPGYAQGVQFGKAQYLNYCASCHGVAGKGDGPIAKSLVNTPADLTKITQNNGNVFPVSRVYEVIDGRFKVESHGSGDMPVWGKIFNPGWGTDLSSGSAFFESKEVMEKQTQVRILALVEYIFTLQAK